MQYHFSHIPLRLSGVNRTGPTRVTVLGWPPLDHIIMCISDMSIVLAARQSGNWQLAEAGEDFRCFLSS